MMLNDFSCTKKLLRKVRISAFTKRLFRLMEKKKEALVDEVGSFVIEFGMGDGSKAIKLIKDSRNRLRSAMVQVMEHYGKDHFLVRLYEQALTSKWFKKLYPYLYPHHDMFPIRKDAVKTMCYIGFDNKAYLDAAYRKLYDTNIATDDDVRLPTRVRTVLSPSPIQDLWAGQPIEFHIYYR
ncbi:MAG: hypothetical protein H6765_07285 [Candidatus Peribacteria bacterium]|nr:MAG: hypothetical protein H6765_07285 [Candidatus Peribacteria bacterium]